MSTLEKENSNQYNAQITYVMGNSTNIIPSTYIKSVTLNDIKRYSNNQFQQNATSDYLEFTLYGIKGNESVKSTLEHINNLTTTTNITASLYPLVAPAKPNLYKIKLTIFEGITLSKFNFGNIDYVNSSDIEYKLYFSYTFGYINFNS